MSKRITTGPFHVPLSPDTSAFFFFGRTNNGLNILLKNHTEKARTVIARVDQCVSTVFPAISVEGLPALPDTTVVLFPDQCTIVAVSISPGNIYRVALRGDIDLDAEKIEVCVTGGSLNVGLVEFADPTLFFRLDDFVKEDDD